MATKGITSLRDRFHWAANRPEQITYMCMPAKKKKKEKKQTWLVTESKWTFCDRIWTNVLQNSFLKLLCVLVFIPSYFSHSHSLCMHLAEDGDDGMGWIFNRFVLGTTMGGGIVVNIITYRSLRLHFPRPCQTGAITHSSLPHLQLTHMHPFLTASVTVPVYTVWICPCLMKPLTSVHPASLWIISISSSHEKILLLCSCCSYALKCGHHAQGPAYQGATECLKQEAITGKDGSLNCNSAAPTLCSTMLLKK